MKHPKGAPESGATEAKLMAEYEAIAEWDVSTRQTNEGFIRRTIKAALGACIGFTGYTTYPAAISAATHGPRPVSIPTAT